MGRGCPVRGENLTVFILGKFAMNRDRFNALEADVLDSLDYLQREHPEKLREYEDFMLELVTLSLDQDELMERWADDLTEVAIYGLLVARNKGRSSFYTIGLLSGIRTLVSKKLTDERRD
jgi:hypothetical protein